jgi:tetratricopeptide (TPR) repeat protein
MELARDDASILNARAETYLLAGEVDDALADADRAVALKSDVASFYETRGRIRENRGERDMAIADFRRALGLDKQQKGALAGLLRLDALP